MDYGRLFRRSVPWVALTVVGIVLVPLADYQPSGLMSLGFKLLGGALTVFGSLGIGAMVGAERADEQTRARMRAPFVRTVELYRGLARLNDEVAYGRGDIAQRDTPSVSTRDVEAHFRAVAVRLQEQGAGQVNAFNEWRQLVPEFVAELEAEREEAS
jgi:hypothetical protein